RRVQQYRPARTPFGEPRRVVSPERTADQRVLWSWRDFPQYEFDRSGRRGRQLRTDEITLAAHRREPFRQHLRLERLRRRSETVQIDQPAARGRRRGRST